MKRGTHKERTFHPTREVNQQDHSHPIQANLGFGEPVKDSGLRNSPFFQSLQVKQKKSIT